MDNRRNYYRILHVQPDAPVEIIKSSYRTLMQRLKQHPDLGGDHWNASLINEAYNVLTNPEDRAKYDRERDLIRRMSAGEPVADPMPEMPDAEEEAENGLAAKASTRSDSGAICLFCMAPHIHGTIDDPEAVCGNCSSPLYPVSEWRLGESGQRAVNRIPRNLEIIFFTTWPQPEAFTGQTLDVSPNGMRFTTAHRLDENHRVKIVSNAINTVALVTHCEYETKNNRWIVGVAFETLRLKHMQGTFFSTEA